MVRALDEDAAPGRAADAREERQRNGDHQRAGAGVHQEGQRLIDPSRPPAVKQAGDDRQQERCQTHQRRIDLGEAGDEPLGRGLRVAGFLHKAQYLRHGGFPVSRRHAHRQHAALIDATAEDAVPPLHVPGQGFARQRGGVERGFALHHNAVQRQLLAGLDEDQIAHRNALRADLHRLPVTQEIRVVRADVHQRRDGCAAVIHRLILEILADLVQRHDRGTLGEFPHRHRADGGHRHQEVLVKHLTSQDVAHRAIQHIIRHGQVGRKEAHYAQDRQTLRQVARKQQHSRSTHPEQQRAALVSAMGMLMVMLMPVLMMMRMPAGTALLMTGAMPFGAVVMLLLRVRMNDGIRLNLGSFGQYGSSHVRKVLFRSHQGDALVHVVYRYALHARQLLQRSLQLCRAVGAVDLDGPCPFHGHSDLSCENQMSYEHLFICDYIPVSSPCREGFAVFIQIAERKSAPVRSIAQSDRSVLSY